MYYRHMDYIPFDVNNPYCLHVMLSNRAYCSIINETFEHGTDETGGLLIGFIVGRKWYVVDVIDPGTNNTIHETGLFQWDEAYVNRMAQRLRNLYRFQPTILGFWHRHPGSMDFFSQTDVESTQKNLQGARKGLISMLVNIDPALRMTFYYCNGPHFMPIRYDVGDEYFPVELLEYADPQMIAQRHVHNQGSAVHVSYKRILPPPTAPGQIPRKSVVADNDVTPNGSAEPEAPETPVTPPAPPVTEPAVEEPPVAEPAVAEPAVEEPPVAEVAEPAETPEVQEDAPFCEGEAEAPELASVDPQEEVEKEIPEPEVISEEAPAAEEAVEAISEEAPAAQAPAEDAPVIEEEPVQAPAETDGKDDSEND